MFFYYAERSITSHMFLPVASLINFHLLDNEPQPLVKKKKSCLWIKYRYIFSITEKENIWEMSLDIANTRTTSSTAHNHSQRWWEYEFCYACSWLCWEGTGSQNLIFFIHAEVHNFVRYLKHCSFHFWTCRFNSSDSSKAISLNEMQTLQFTIS